MADELPPAVAKFIADTSQYTDPLQKAIDATEKWGDQTNESALKAKQAIRQAQEAEDKAAQSARDAEKAMDSYAKGEMSAKDAADAYTKAQSDQEKASLAVQQAQKAVATATEENSRAQDRLKKSTDDAEKSGFMEMSMLQKLNLIAGFATGSLEPLAAALLAVVGGLASGLAAAGIGLAVFGAVAKSAFTTADTAAAAAKTAQTTYTASVRSATAAYDKAMKTASTAAEREAAKTAENTALKQAETTKVKALNTAYQGLSKSQVDLAQEINNAEAAWDKFVARNTSGVSQIMAQGLGLLPRIFQLLQPFMAPVEKALSGIISDLSRAIAPAEKVNGAVVKMVHGFSTVSKVTRQQGGLATFLQVMSANAGPAITKIFKAVMNLAGGIGHLLETFAPFAQTMLSGLDAITAKFDTWAASLGKTAGFAEFMTMVKTQGPTIVGILKNLAVIATQFLGDMSGSASNMIWLKALPGITQFAAAFMKANPALIKNAMNLMLVTSTAKQAFGVMGKGVSTVSGLAKSATNLARGFGLVSKATDDAGKVVELKGAAKGIENVRNLAKGLTSSKAAASEATGAWGTFGGKISTVFTAPVKGIGNLAKGLGSSEAAASEATGAMGTLGGKISSLGSSIASVVATSWSGLTSGISAAVTAIKGWTIWSKLAAASTKVWTGIQAAFDAVMALNPIILIVVAIVALVAIIVICYIKFKSFRDIVNDVGRALKSGFLDALHTVEAAAGAVWKFIDSNLVHPLESGISSLVSWVKSHWKLLATIIATVLLGPIGGLIAYIATHWSQIKQLTSNLVNDIKKAFDQCVAWLKDAWNDIVAAAKTAWDFLVNCVKTDVGLVKNVLAWFEQLGSLFRGWWNDAVNAVESVAGRMLSYIRQLPGRIKSGLGNIGSLLYGAGRNVIQGLINGITSMIGNVTGAISNVVSEIRSHLPFSPAKKGPLSGAGSPDIAGRKISQMLAQGITAGAPAISAAMSRATQFVSSTIKAQGTLHVQSSAVPSAVAAAGTSGAVQSGVLGGASRPQQITLQAQFKIEGTVDKQVLFQANKSQTYRYNIRNSGQVTGAVKPGAA